MSRRHLTNRDFRNLDIVVGVILFGLYAYMIIAILFHLWPFH